ncbi:MAG: DUF4091 domain-containing protein [Oscillospiraceae bacterium]|nr:DUF4091 domain-containing protein [Oscillospiraceae bacterium]MCL2278542.1 DUF4091 domain-containing protein [Oscillospiraceae bacterium]
MELKIYNSLAKVFSHGSLPNAAECMRLSALMDETVSFQAAYMRSEGDLCEWAMLRIKTSSKMSVSASRVRCIPGYLPAHFKTDGGYLETEGGLYPDLLEPFEVQAEKDGYRIPLTPGSWQSCWIDICAGHEAKAGTHSITVSIENLAGETLAHAEVSLEVIAQELPPLDIFHTRWFHTDCLAEYYDIEVFSERHWEVVENFAAFAVKHGINTLLTPIHTPPLDTEVGGERLTVQLIDVSMVDSESLNAKYIFNFDKLERWVNMCKKVGVEHYEMAHLFTQWGAKHAPKIMGTKNNEYIRLFGWESDATGKEYANYLKQMLPALTAKLEELGIADKTIFHVSDEPEMKHMEAYKAAQSLVKPLLEGYKIVDALTNYNLYKQCAVSVPVPAVDHIEPFLRGDVPEGMWCYFCCAQSYKVPNHFFMQPSYRSRILGVLLYKFDIKGFLHWGYNFYNSMQSVYPINPFYVTDADGAFPSGDAFVVYPGKEGLPLASLRLKVIRDAFDDYRALRLLENQRGRDAVLDMIEDGLQKPLTFSCFPQHDEYILNLRQRVNTALNVM